MKRFILFENEKGFLVINDGGIVVRYTLIMKEATDMPFRIVIKYIQNNRYVFESPLYQDTPYEH